MMLLYSGSGIKWGNKVNDAHALVLCKSIFKAAPPITTTYTRATPTFLCCIISDDVVN